MEIKRVVSLLAQAGESDIHIMLPGGAFVPAHFHVTEVGRVQKKFVDCGGTKRELDYCVIQVWLANDIEHRISSKKLTDIICLSDKLIGLDNLEVMVEYGKDVVSQYFVSNVELTPKGPLFTLVAKETECLAPDKCGVGGCVQECGC